MNCWAQVDVLIFLHNELKQDFLFISLFMLLKLNATFVVDLCVLHKMNYSSINSVAQKLLPLAAYLGMGRCKICVINLLLNK